MPLEGSGATSAVLSDSAATANLMAGKKKPCIGVSLVNKNGNVPAHIKFYKHDNAKNDAVCKQVAESEPVAAYFNSKVKSGENTNIESAVAIGSSKGAYSAASSS